MTTLVMRNDVAELRRMSVWLAAGCAASGMSKDVIQRMDLCANEALANIISYAYEEPGRHDITLELSARKNGVRLIIRDDGRPFDPVAAPEHHQPASLAEAEIGGLGLHLIRKLLSGCEYRREQNCNVLVLDAHTETPPK